MKARRYGCLWAFGYIVHITSWQWLLLGYAVYIASAVGDFFCAHTDDSAFREDCLNLFYGEAVILVTVLRQDYSTIYDEEIEIRSYCRFTHFPRDTAGNSIYTFHVWVIYRSFCGTYLVNLEPASFGINGI